MLKIFQRNLSLTTVKAAGALEDSILNKIKNKYGVSVDNDFSSSSSSA